MAGAQNLSSYGAFRTKRLELGGTFLSYVEVGSGRTVLLLPALEESMLTYWHQLGNSSPPGRILSFDHVGSGLSDRPAVEYSPSDYVRYTLRFVDKLVEDRATVCAHGTAAPLAIALGVSRPEKVRSLTLSCPVFPSTGGSARPALRAATRAPVEQLARPVRMAAKYLGRKRAASRLARLLPPEARAAGRSIFLKGLLGPGWFEVEERRKSRWNAWTDWLDRWDEVHIRTRVVWASSGPRQLRAAAKPILSKLRVDDETEVEQCRSHPMLENPLRFSEVLQEY